jgi:hypothetical protein
VTTKICNGCGKRIPIESNFCNICGKNQKTLSGGGTIVDCARCNGRGEVPVLGGLFGCEVCSVCGGKGKVRV